MSAVLSGPCLRTRLSAVLLSLALVACGGGSDDSPPAPTPLPASLSIQAPASGEVGASLRFAQSAGASQGLSFSWTFGDGNSSSSASPEHRYQRGGDYEVLLRVRNEAGESREARWRLTVNNTGHLQGLSCSGAAHAGWCWQQPTPTGNAVSRLFFSNADTGWRVGELGEIFKTVDGGRTWQQLRTGIDAAIQDLAVIDAQNLLAVGAYGALLRSSDGGVNWQLSRLSAPTHAWTVLSIDYAKDQRLILSDGSRIYGSTDGGQNWHQAARSTQMAVLADGSFVTLGYEGVYRSVDAGKTMVLVLPLDGGPNVSALLRHGDRHLAFSSSRNRYVDNLGWVEQREIWRSADGGANWTAVTLGNLDLVPNAWGPLQLVDISADGQGVVAFLGGSAIRSQDGGQSWQLVGLPPPSPTNPWLRAVRQLGLGLLVIDSDRAHWSVDGGQSWLPVSLPVSANEPFYQSEWTQVDADTLLAKYGQRGYLSKDKGRSWQLAYTLPENHYGFSMRRHGLSFVDDRHGWLIDSTGQLLRSQDGGRSWTPLPGAAQLFPHSIRMLDRSNGWMSDHMGRLLRTQDGGESWQERPNVPANVQQWRFNSASEGWARIDDRRVMVTRDGGQTWTLIGVPFTAEDLEMSAGRWIVAGLQGRIAGSDDQGVSWSEFYTGTGARLRGVARIDAQTLLAYGEGGALLRSGDNGRSWKTLAISNQLDLNDAHFIDAKVGWLVGSAGTVLYTADGGLSWQAQASNSRSIFTQVLVLDAKTAWLYGPGVLLATGTGGH